MEKMIKSAAFHPWIGAKYAEGINGKRLLVLGESHYHNCEEPQCRELENEVDRTNLHQRMTHDVVEFWKDNPHRSPLSYRVPELFCLSKAEFWPQVVFYNYLQTFAGKKAKERPAASQWEESQSAPAFQEVLSVFAPDRILVLGKELWINLPSSDQHLARRPRAENSMPVSTNSRSFNDVDRTCYWYSTKDEKAALAMPIMHPSAPGFRTTDWSRAVTEWMTFGD